jgi:nucleoside-diphosphate-sugar epimerase
MKSIFITGTTGFVGRTVLRKLAETGFRVRAAVRKMPATPLPDTEILIADLADQHALTAAMKGCDGVIHLAACARNWTRNPGEFDKTNVEGTQHVLAAAEASGVQRVVHTSTVLTIGPSNGSAVDESAQRKGPALTDYERTKLAAERIVAEFVRNGLHVVMVNPTRIFGPGPLTEANSVTIMVRDYLRGRWHLLPGNGNAVGNYAYIEDVADGIVGALLYGRAGERYILGGENLTYRQLFDIVNRISGKSHTLFPVPALAAGFFSRLELLRATVFNSYPLITPGWVTTLFGEAAYSCAKAERELGYRITPFETAIHTTIDWLQQKDPTSEGQP